jgi:hypothetical protein
MTGHATGGGRWQSLLIRESRHHDASGLARLAELDDRALPESRFLIAEVAGELVAAAPLDVAEPPFGDPFRPTEQIRRLLDQQARQLRSSTAGRRRGSWRGQLQRRFVGVPSHA